MKPCLAILRAPVFIALMVLSAILLTAPALVFALDAQVDHAQMNADAPARAPTPTPRARAARAPNARTITFTYDNAGRLTEANYGSGTRITFAYDNAGDLLTMQTLAADLRIFMPVILK